jgi:putative DNA primase/helicase
MTPSDLAWQYLTVTRRLALPVVPDVLRYSAAVKAPAMINDRWHTGPAMVAMMQGPDGSHKQTHLTFLTPDARKLGKLLMKSPGQSWATSSAIRLFEAGERLGVAEGVETALACHVDTGLPVWAAGNRILLESMAIPETVRELFIFADNDQSGDGLKSAKKLAARAYLHRLRVKVLLAPEVGSDWADIVCQVGDN